MMYRDTAILALLAAFLLIVTAGSAQAARTKVTVTDGKHHWFLPNHPRLRRISKAMGCGLVTGGLAAPIMGGAVATGAVAGAAENGTVRGVKDTYDLKKHRKLDKSIF